MIRTQGVNFDIIEVHKVLKIKAPTNALSSFLFFFFFFLGCVLGGDWGECHLVRIREMHLCRSTTSRSK